MTTNKSDNVDLNVNPQWSHDVYEVDKKENNGMKTLLLIVVIGALGYGLIMLLGPILK